MYPLGVWADKAPSLGETRGMAVCHRFPVRTEPRGGQRYGTGSVALSWVRWGLKVLQELLLESCVVQKRARYCRVHPSIRLVCLIRTAK